MTIKILPLETNPGEPSIRPPSCTTPWQSTLNIWKGGFWSLFLSLYDSANHACINCNRIIYRDVFACLTSRALSCFTTFWGQELLCHFIFYILIWCAKFTKIWLKIASKLLSFSKFVKNKDNKIGGKRSPPLKSILNISKWVSDSKKSHRNWKKIKLPSYPSIKLWKK